MSSKNQNPDDIKILDTPYGAPELKSSYRRFASRGLIIAIVIHVVLISSYVFSIYLENLNAGNQEDMKTEVTIFEILPDIPPPATNEAEPPPPDIEIPQSFIPQKDLEALIPEPVARKDAEVLTTKTQEALEEVKGPVSSEGTDNPSNVTFSGPIAVQEKKIEEKVEKKEVKKEEVKKSEYQQFEVDKAPNAVNLAAIRGSMSYPEIARSAGTEGTVVAKVLVNTDGSVVRVGGLSGPDVFHREVRSKVMGLKFTPALQNGQPVRCWVSVPFRFTLSSQFKKKAEEDDE
jgi:TonB family protein